ncbi:hypothetical protein JCM8097_006848 [Rhodosporidiobolus ruineniae]
MADQGVEVAVLPARSARSCTECSRRKISCDRNIPCGACVKRGASAACSAAPTKRKKPNVNPAHELSQRQSAALDELRLFRTTLDSLRARLPGLEHFVANAQLKEEDSAELDEVVKGFGDPTTLIPRREEEDGGEAVNGTSGAGPSSLSRRTSGAASDLNGFSAVEPPKKKARVAEPKKEEDQSGNNVEAAVSLEFYTLGRPRTWAEASHLRGNSGENGEADELDQLDLPSSPSHQLAVLPPEQQPETPLSRFPDGVALQEVAPDALAESVLLDVGLDLYGFHHAVVHSATFRAQVTAFHSLGEDAFTRASPAWMSLYFAVLAVSAKLITREQTDEVGWTDEQMFKAAGDWFDCCVACLYRANFLQVHDLSSLQAIAILVLSGRDAGSATLIASLLYSGLSVAQDLGLHRLPSDEAWDAALKGRPVRVRAKSLIDREIRKRVLWALVHSEWFAIPFKGYSLLSKVQITTPLPLNATDSDLAGGELIDRPRDEFTPVSWLLRYVEIGRHMSTAFEHSSTEKATAAQAYQAFLEADKQLEGVLNNLPAWLKADGDETGLPDGLAETVRKTFLVSLHHKILSIHRPFLAKPSRATTYAFSRRRVIEAARAILREAPSVRTNRIWTTVYHLSVALFSLALELYEQLKTPSAENEAIREEINAALPTLEGLKDVSAIAERGLGLVLPLLADEERMRLEGSQLKEKEKRKARPSGGARTSSTKNAATSSASSSVLASPQLAQPSASPTLSIPPLPSGLPPFSNPFLPGVSPDPASAAYPFGVAASLPDPSFLAAAASAGAGGAPAPGTAPHPYAGYLIPPWLYGEQFSQLTAGLDGSAGGTPGPSVASAGAGGATPLPYPGYPYGAYGVPPPPTAAASQAMAAWGMMPPAPPGAGGYGSALGWDWLAMGAGGFPSGAASEGADSPARRAGEGEGK